MHKARCWALYHMWFQNTNWSILVVDYQGRQRCSVCECSCKERPSGVIESVCTPIHTNTNLPRNIEVTIRNHQADNPLCVAWCLTWLVASSEKVWSYMTLNVLTENPLGDKVSMLTHTYPHKARRKIEVTVCKITRLTAHFMCGLVSDLLICTCL